jgi:hypothetical protein
LNFYKCRSTSRQVRFMAWKWMTQNKKLRSRSSMLQSRSSGLKRNSVRVVDVPLTITIKTCLNPTNLKTNPSTTEIKQVGMNSTRDSHLNNLLTIAVLVTIAFNLKACPPSGPSPVRTNSMTSTMSGLPRNKTKSLSQQNNLKLVARKTTPKRV